MIIRNATSADIPQLKNLWQVCFGDEIEYIDRFFDSLFVPESTIVAQVDEQVAGVVYLLDAKYGKTPFKYGYAIGVLPEYRGKSICKNMLDYIKEWSRKSGFIFGLHPANKKLAEFYQKIGLSEMYSLKEVDGTGFLSDNLYELEQIDADEMYVLRKNAFNDLVEWDVSVLDYMIKSGEVVKKITLQGKSIYFVIRKNGETVIVKETSANESEIIEVSESIKRYFGAKNIKYTLSSDKTLQGTIEPCLYGFSGKNDNVYMNLFLD